MTDVDSSAVSAPAPPKPVVAYFGPAATNTHMAALRMFGDRAEFVPYLSINDIFEAVAKGAAQHGVVPIENSIEGVVRVTVDCLLSKPPLIEAECELRIHHCLMGPPGLAPAQARQVMSHPQALAQCRRWLEVNLRGVAQASSSSTSMAAEQAAMSNDTLAIASELAAKRHGLEIKADDIADRQLNTTRFICVASQDAPPSGADRTSLVFTTPHERGALRQVLGLLDDAGVNMTRIESRPLPDRLWEYAFVVDVEGHRAEEPVRSALEALQERGHLIRVLGSYPRAALQEP